MWNLQIEVRVNVSCRYCTYVNGQVCLEGGGIYYQIVWGLGGMCMTIPLLICFPREFRCPCKLGAIKVMELLASDVMFIEE